MTHPEKGLSGHMTGPLREAPKPLGNPGNKQAQLDGFVDQVLTAQRAELTEANRESIREKIGHITFHRS